MALFPPLHRFTFISLVHTARSPHGRRWPGHRPCRLLRLGVVPRLFAPGRPGLDPWRLMLNLERRLRHGENGAGSGARPWNDRSMRLVDAVIPALNALMRGRRDPHGLTLSSVRDALSLPGLLALHDDPALPVKHREALARYVLALPGWAGPVSGRTTVRESTQDLHGYSERPLTCLLQRMEVSA